jgi:hypothetical protein
MIFLARSGPAQNRRVIVIAASAVSRSGSRFTINELSIFSYLPLSDLQATPVIQPEFNRIALPCVRGDLFIRRLGRSPLQSKVVASGTQAVTGPTMTLRDADVKERLSQDQRDSLSVAA